MNGPIAQIVALTCHLNARRRGIVNPGFFPNNSTCQFCESVCFLRRKRRFFARGWETVARTPDEWLRLTVESDFSRAVLLHGTVNDPQFSDRMTAGLVGGGGRWLLSIQRNGDADWWEAGWEVGNQQAADRRIWKVQYALVAEREVATADTVAIDGLITELAETLSQIEAFAWKHDLRGFAESFQKALSCLSSDDPLSLVYHRDLAPEGALNLPAARLLACCQAAWVFGGMGSWNDLGFDGADEDQYQTLSDRLFGLVNRAICSGANSTAVPA